MPHARALFHISTILSFLFLFRLKACQLHERLVEIQHESKVDGNIPQKHRSTCASRSRGSSCDLMEPLVAQHLREIPRLSSSSLYSNLSALVGASRLASASACMDLASRKTHIICTPTNKVADAPMRKVRPVKIGQRSASRSRQ